MKERIIKFIESLGIPVSKFENECGIANGSVSKMGYGTRRSTLDKISKRYPQINRIWLLTGEGNMLNDDTPSQPTTPQPPQEHTHIIKYWVDVDTSAGYVDFPTNPNEREYKKIVLPDFKDCTDAVNLYGDSMYPLYKNGEVIVLKRWDESFIDYGNAYLIITKNGNRMVKYIRQGSDDAHVLCLSENKNFDSFEILRDDILQLYIVKGSIKKNTL
jgi:phage repressor protein C with HTH and peptisase S24 domain